MMGGWGVDWQMIGQPQMKRQKVRDMDRRATKYEARGRNLGRI